uniref:Uncharacterized protein n=1 Tax=Parascaris equorum TaxID=6256 RepID=A0A914R2N3_PAREQ
MLPTAHINRCGVVEEEMALNSEAAMGALRKKHNDAVAELSDQLDTIQKARAKFIQRIADLFLQAYVLIIIIGRVTHVSCYSCLHNVIVPLGELMLP